MTYKPSGDLETRDAVTGQYVSQTSDINLDIDREQVAGKISGFFFGFNDSMGNDVWEDVHPLAGDIQWQTSAAAVEAISTNTDDTLAGAGVQKLEIHGLSDTGADQEDVINMNGTSVSTATTNTYRRVNLCHSEEVGTYGGSHRGNVTLRRASAGATMATMTGREGLVNSSVQYGSGEAGNGYYSVPLGKVMYIRRIEVVPNVPSSGTKTIDIVLYEREGILDTTTPFLPRRLLWEATEITEAVEKPFPSGIKIKELTDVWFRAKASAASSKVSVHVDFYLVDKDANNQ